MNIVEAVEFFGIDLKVELEGISRENLKQRQAAIRAKIKSAYRKRIAAAHPDTGGSHEAAIEIMDAYRECKEFTLTEKRRRPPPIVIVRYGFAGAWGDGTSTTNATSTYT